MKKVLILLSVCGVLSFTGCIDREFDLADVSGEITLGGEELVVPLADIGEIYLGDLLEGNDVISSNENGVYQIAFSSFGDDRSKWEAIGIDGISIPAITGLSPELKPISFELEELPTTMTMAGISESFVAEFPKIDNVNLSINPITKNEDLGSLPNKLKGSLGKLGFSGDTGTITPTILNLLGDNASLSDEFSGSTNFSIEVNDIPEQVSSVNVVEFGNAKNDYGSPFEVKIDLGGMSGIVGGGVLTINVEFPSSYYLCDENGVEFSEGANNKLNKEINLQPGQELVSVIVYLKNIKFENQGNGGIAINDTISYGYDLNFNLQAGDFDLSKLPQFSINAVPECKDIIVTVGNVDKEMKVEDYVCKFERSFEMPEGIKIEKVLFKNTELKLNMSGLQWLSIDGEQVAMNITFPKCMVFANHPLLAKYADGATYLLANATELANGITLQLDAIDCEAKDEGVVFANGELKVNSDIVVKAEVPSVNGKTMSVSSLISTLTPSPDYVTDTDNNGKWNVNVNVSIEGSELQLDTENTVVKWSEERTFDLNLGDSVPGFSQSIEVPEMIASIDNIAIGNANKEGEPVAIDFTLSAGNSFPIDNLEVDVTVDLGNILHPTAATLKNGVEYDDKKNSYILKIKRSWDPTAGPLSQRVEFDALTNMPEIKDGKLAIDQKFDIQGSVKVKAGDEVDLSKISEAQINIDVKIDDIEVREFKGKLDVSVAPEPMSVELGDMSNLGVDIQKLNINPVLKLNLKDNPVGVPFYANVALKTYNADGVELVDINVSKIAINANGPTNLVITTANKAAQYEDAIVAEGLEKLLSAGIPAKIEVEMSVYSDTKKSCTINLASAKKGFQFEYQYEVVMPLEFDGEVDLAYQTTVGGLGETFDSLSGEMSGLKVGDIGLIVELGTTIPFDINLSAKLVNKDGTTNNVKAKIVFDNGRDNTTIAGWREEDGESPRVSKFDIMFDLGDSHALTALKNVDGIQLGFSLSNPEGSTSSAIANTQFLTGNLKLRVRDGVTVDVIGLLNQ